MAVTLAGAFIQLDDHLVRIADIDHCWYEHNKLHVLLRNSTTGSRVYDDDSRSKFNQLISAMEKHYATTN